MTRAEMEPMTRAEMLEMFNTLAKCVTRLEKVGENFDDLKQYAEELKISERRLRKMLNEVRLVACGQLSPDEAVDRLLGSRAS